MYQRSDFYRAVLAVMLIAGTGACTAGSAVSTPAKSVEVVRNSGLKQCGDETPSPEIYAKLLQANGVKVFSSACATDGAMRAQVCGADQGLFYVYEIDPAGLSKALELGFADLAQDPSASRFRKLPCTNPGQQGGGSAR
ncbi:MAG TPA: hypothetical protein VGC70_00180 [Burkholderiales bacterium]